LDEILIAGELQESSKKTVARLIAAQVWSNAYPTIDNDADDDNDLILISSPNFHSETMPNLVHYTF